MINLILCSMMARLWRTLIAELFIHSHECYAEEEYDDDDILVCQPSPFDEVWLSEPERCNCSHHLECQCTHTAACAHELETCEIHCILNVPILHPLTWRSPILILIMILCLIPALNQEEMISTRISGPIILAVSLILILNNPLS